MVRPSNLVAKSSRRTRFRRGKKPTEAELANRVRDGFAGATCEFLGSKVVIYNVPIVPSKKNRGQGTRNGGKRKPLDVAVAEKCIRALVIEATHKDRPLWLTEDCELSYVESVNGKSMTVTVRPIGPQPKGRSGRWHDLHGTLETIADALQGVTYEDDRQIAQFSGRRDYSE